MWECIKNSNYLPVPSPMNSRPGSVASFYNQVHHSRSHSSMATMRLKRPINVFSLLSFNSTVVASLQRSLPWEVPGCKGHPVWTVQYHVQETIVHKQIAHFLTAQNWCLTCTPVQLYVWIKFGLIQTRHSNIQSYKKNILGFLFHFFRDDNMSCPATKVFLSADLTNQWYLCYILPIRFQLCLVQIDFSDPDNIRLGSTSTITAKDAVPIPVSNYYRY